MNFIETVNDSLVYHDWMSPDERGKVMRGLLSVGKLRLAVGGYINIFPTSIMIKF